MATHTHGATGSTERDLAVPIAGRQPFPLLDALVACAVQPTFVVNADDPQLTVVAANDTARAELCRDGLGAPLSIWLGDATSQAIAASIVQGESEGTTGGWRWRVAAMDTHRWLICNSIPQPTAEADGALGRSESDQHLIETYEAALTVGSDLALEAVLQRIVDVAREVVPSRYAALGVADEQGKMLQFITSGITPEERAAIGPIPQGHGLLGVLIQKGQPLLIPEIGTDPHSVGFPSDHPPMRTLMGVPIKLGDRVLGDLYLTERMTATPFTEDDLATLEMLAVHAAAAIERAELYEEVQTSHQRVEEQRDQLQAILDNLPSAVIILTPPDGVIEMANAAAKRLTLGDDAPPGAVLKHLRDYRMLDTDGIPLAHEFRPGVRVLHDLIVRNQQLLIERRDGHHVPVLVQATPLYDGKGRLNRAVLVMQDITRLREAEQLKDDFLSLISHEFRTPLTTIHGGAHLLVNQSDAVDAETRQGLLADIVVESERLDRMLRNMLSLAAIMAGRLTAATEPVLVEPLVRSVSEEVAARAPHHAFILDLPVNLPPIEADPDLLTQVLRNLYENAVKYAPSGGDISTTATVDTATVTVHVSDQGIGIVPEHVPYVFERFRRPGADPTVRGMGLGLYLSRHLVEAQGGRIEARSAGPGCGATFSVTLPIARGWVSPATDRESRID